MFFWKCFSCRTFIISIDLERYWHWLGNGCCCFHSVGQHFIISRMKLHKLSISLNNYDHYESIELISNDKMSTTFDFNISFNQNRLRTVVVYANQKITIYDKKNKIKITVYWKTADYIIPAKCLIFVERIRRSMLHNLIRITATCSFVIDCGMYAS